MARCQYVGMEEGVQVRCKADGIYGLRRGDPTYEHSHFLQKARYCKTHKHWDDVNKEKEDARGARKSSEPCTQDAE